MPLKLQFFGEVAKQLNSFLIKFQTDSPMVPFLLESLESMIQKFCSMFNLTDVLEKAQSTVKLLKLNVTHKNIHKRDSEFSFAIKNELCALNRDGKFSDFNMEAKEFLPTLCNHILEKTPLNSYFARCTRSLSPL